MKPWMKPVLYGVLSLLAIWMAFGFYQNLRISNEEAGKRSVDTDTETAGPVRSGGAQGRMMRYAFGFMGCAIALGFMISKDFSYWFATKGTETLMSDNVDPSHDPNYDYAEQIALEGKHLEAIGLLREFLKRNPREIYAAIRIAEIYEKDLFNPLAAALEYEEVLKHKFSPERWGWAAIHLVNLYSGKLNKQAQAAGWLRRVEAEHPNTAAAKKARERLGTPDMAALVPTEDVVPPPPSSGGLPPGFSPKKR